jgi:hypothetical protein
VNIPTKYFVVSLPRTGTTSICKMAKMCGLNPKHAPQMYFDNFLEKNDFDFFSDTPVFCPSVIRQLVSNEKIKAKFIYIDRDFDVVFDSWKRVNLYNNYSNMVSVKNKGDTLSKSMQFDLDSYENAFDYNFLDENNYKSIFENHKKNIIDIIENAKKPLLIYDFNSGWESFCEFLNVDIPKDNIPILNKNKMFDKL